MLKSLLSHISRRASKFGASLALCSLAGSSLLLTSCTTEEGVVAGALAGAAIGGLVGHSSENSYKRSRYPSNNYRTNNGNRHYDDRRYGNNRRYDDGRYGYPQQSRYIRSSAYRAPADPYCYY